MMMIMMMMMMMIMMMMMMMLMMMKVTVVMVTTTTAPDRGGEACAEDIEGVLDFLLIGLVLPKKVLTKVTLVTPVKGKS